MKNKLLNLENNYLLLLALFLTSLSFGQNLYDSSGAIIWDATANSGYNNNIKFIGRDDAISLNLKQNTSSTPKVGLGVLAATNAANSNSFAVDKNYLVWGENGGSTNDSGTDVTITFGGTSGVTTQVDIPNKKWKVVETNGDVGMTKISFPTSDFSNLPALSGNDSYVMIVANDPAFTSGVETVFLTTSGSNKVGNFDFDGTKYFTFGVSHQHNFSRSLSLNGTNNFVKFDAVNNLPSSFTMMFWMRPTGQNALSNDRTIVSKYNGNTGYRVYLANNHKLNVSWNGGTPLTSNTALSDGLWHNIAIVYYATTSTLTLYIDGVQDSAVTSNAPTSDNSIFSIGAEYRSKTDIRNYFKGDLDEFRLWKRVLGLGQLRYIINQEIVQNGAVTSGAILPFNTTKNDINTMNWVNLVAYYSMNSFIGTHIDDDSITDNKGYLFTNSAVTIAQQTAPIPYESTADGTWSNSATWISGSVPNSNSIVNPSIPITWNIVKTNHNINSSSNHTLLGLIVNSNTISATNDSKLEISHYLKLDGKIDLVGKSQLIQTDNSDLDVTSSGYIERDQQGQANLYNYNYWSSPVSTINNSSNNNGFTVAGVMKDGTTSTPQNINWTSGINGSPTSPITLSSYWIFKFQDVSNGYANWSAAGQNGALLAGQGYTLKGSGTAAANQNYTFVGKPNNGTITSTVSSGNLNLSGNPYPSAIDANRFIDDNATSTTGTLYFWEHYSTNTSHATIQYQGGYATYTKTGGTAPVAPSGVSSNGSSRRKPGRYIPVGQGFFVTGSSSGGTITFNNNQRTFITENNRRSNQLFRANVSTVNESNEMDDPNDEEQFTKIYLGFDSADQLHRQTLIGFMNQYATSGIDNGYDGLSIENFANDMYFINGDTKLNILGEGYFNENSIYPIGVKNAINGIVKFSIDEKENLDENQNVYIFDNTTNEYHNITSEGWEINLPAGTYDNRFSLRFLNPTALGTNDNEIQGITVAHTQSNNMINIHNESIDENIKSVSLYNLIGQNITQWKLDTQDQTHLQLSVAGLNSGTYIVKINTDKGTTSKKIIIK